MDGPTGGQACGQQERIRVLHLLHTLERGGAEQLLASWFTRGGSEQFTYEVCCLFRGGPHEATITAADVPVHVAGMSNPVDPRGLSRAMQVVRRFRPHVIHTHLRCADLWGPLLARSAGGARLLTTIHNSADHYFEPGEAIGRAEASIYTWASKLSPRPYAAISHAVAEDIARHLGKRRSVTVVHNAIDCRGLEDALIRDRRQMRTELDIAQEATVFLCAARLEFQKGHANLLRAFAEVQKSYPQALLLLAGEGSQRETLEALRDELKLGDTVRFLGERSDVPELLGAADIAVSASIYEGFGISLIEAMALGVPVIATRVGGVPEFIRDRQTGILTTPDNCAELAQDMLQLCRDAALRTTLAENGRKYVREHFDIARMIDQYEEIYRQLVR